MRCLYHLLFFSSLSFCLSVSAQTTPEEMKANPLFTAGNYFAYPKPTAVSTPAPAGYSPFYISHYGRHGSRYMIDGADIADAYNLLNTADGKGKLTDQGKEVMAKLFTASEVMQNRGGDLTPLGQQQHKEIAERMFHNYPEVFKGSTAIDAKATTKVRCVLSMDAFCQKLTELNPHLQITNDASEHDMYFMCKERDVNRKGSTADSQWQKKYDAFCAKNYHYDHLMKVLFADTTGISADKQARLARQIFNVACALQNMPQINFELLSLFTPEERFGFWQCQNAYWYSWAGLSSEQEGTGPYIGANLLQNILDQATLALSKPDCSVTLRFGHDSGILPLISLLKVKGCDAHIANLDSLYTVWTDFRLIPMASNLQFVFYRKPESTDVLVKVLLNEAEVQLPVSTDVAPYYHWNAFRDYYQQILNTIPSNYKQTFTKTSHHTDGEKGLHRSHKK